MYEGEQWDFAAKIGFGERDTEGGYSSAPMKLFKDVILLTGRSEPRVPPEVYMAISDTIQACQLGGADPMQAAEEGSQRMKASSPDTRVPRCSDESLSFVCIESSRI